MTAQRPDGKSGSQRVSFTRQGADRIARVVRIVERGDRKGNALTFGNRSASVSGSSEKIFRVGTQDSSAWAKGAVKTVTFITVTTTPNTVSAMNLFADIATGSTGRAVAVAKDGTGWYLIAAECE